MGADAIRDLLAEIDLEDLSAELRNNAKHEKSVQRKKEMLKRLRIVEAFRQSKNRPEWMILQVIPVLPPDLRPLVPLEGGRFATSDLNESDSRAALDGQDKSDHGRVSGSTYMLAVFSAIELSASPITSAVSAFIPSAIV